MYQFCPFCGYKLAGFEQICPQCGKPLMHENAANGMGNAQAYAQPNYPENAPAPYAQPGWQTAPQPMAPAPQPGWQTAPQPMAPAPQPGWQAAPQPMAPAPQPGWQVPPQPMPYAPVPPAAPGMLSAAAGIAAAPVRRGSRRGLIALLILLAGVIISLGIIFLPELFVSDEEKIIERFAILETAIQEGDIEAAVDCCDKTMRKTYAASIGLAEGIVGGIIGFDLPLGSLMELGGLGLGMYGYTFDIEVLSVVVSDDTATVQVLMTMDGSTEQFEVPMKKEGGDWYINLTSLLMDEALSGTDFGYMFG